MFSSNSPFTDVDNDILGEPNAVVEELADMMTRYNRWRAEDAARRQERLLQDRRVVVSRDARAMPTLAIDPYVYHHIGLRFGYECWDDPDFVDYVERSMPVRVKPVSERPTVAAKFGDSKLETRREPKFSKNYGEL